jgi:excisionase family DNA binding protein
MAAPRPLPLPIPKPSIEGATLLTIPRAAELLSVSRDSIYDLVHAGSIPAVLVKGKMRIRLTDLNRYVQRLT